MSPAPDLEGTWVFDASRVEQLEEVASTRAGPSRALAAERARRDFVDLWIAFTNSKATLHTATTERTVNYRVVRWQGPLVVLVADEADGIVSTSVKVEGDRLTWFDSRGEVEFVLKRTTDDGKSSGLPTAKGDLR